jgi:Ca-activated chloride channel homolog
MRCDRGGSFELNRRICGAAYFPQAAIVFAFATMCQVFSGFAQDADRSPCTEDAMLVFDASGSMSGNGWGYGSESAHTVSRIDKVRYALGKVLPSVTRFRRVGLVAFGPTRNPGLFNQCDNIEVDLPPAKRRHTHNGFGAKLSADWRDTVGTCRRAGS